MRMHDAYAGPGSWREILITALRCGLPDLVVATYVIEPHMPWPRASAKQIAQPAPQVLIVDLSALALKSSCVQKFMIRAAHIHHIVWCLVILHYSGTRRHPTFTECCSLYLQPYRRSRQ